MICRKEWIIKPCAITDCFLLLLKGVYLFFTTRPRVTCSVLLILIAGCLCVCVCVCALFSVYALKPPQGVSDKSLCRNAYESVSGSGEVGKCVFGQDVCHYPSLRANHRRHQQQHKTILQYATAPSYYPTEDLNKHILKYQGESLQRANLSLLLTFTKILKIKNGVFKLNKQLHKALGLGSMAYK